MNTANFLLGCVWLRRWKYASLYRHTKVRGSYDHSTKLMKRHAPRPRDYMLQATIYTKLAAHLLPFVLVFYTLDLLWKNYDLSVFAPVVVMGVMIYFITPLVVILPAAKLFAAIVEREDRRYLRTRRIRLCYKCGYDMTGVPSVTCAECAHEADTPNWRSGPIGWWLRKYGEPKPLHTTVWMRTLWPDIKRFCPDGPTRREWFRIEPGQYVPWFIQLSLPPFALSFLLEISSVAVYLAGDRQLEVTLIPTLKLASTWALYSLWLLVPLGLFLSWKGRRGRIRTVLAKHTAPREA